MCFNIGVVIGPIMGGFAADPIHSFPGLFGENSVFGGEQGVGWMAKWPYALPQLVSSFFILMSAFAVIMGLDETHPARRDKPDYGRKLGRYLSGSVLRRKPQHRYTSLDGQEGAWRDASIDLEEDPRPPSQPAPDMPAPTTPPDNRFEHPQPPPNTSPQPKDPPKPKIFTTNVLLTLATHFVVALHVSAFNALIFILLPAPRSQNSPATTTLFRFTGGLGLPTAKVGLATAIIGIIGFPLQILAYPPLSARLGTLRTFRAFLPFSALAYAALPYLVLIPDSSGGGGRAAMWACLTLVLAAQVSSRTFSLPSMIILVNNSAPDPRVLGTIHGVAQSTSSGARTLGPIVGGWLLGLGLQGNCVGGVWWGMAGLVVVNWGLLWLIREG